MRSGPCKPPGGLHGRVNLCTPTTFLILKRPIYMRCSPASRWSAFGRQKQSHGGSKRSCAQSLPEFQKEGTESVARHILPGWSGDYSPGDVLGGKYIVNGIIGRGSNGVTYKATLPDDKEVAIKALSLRRMTDWKQLDLFKREAEVLAALAHPGIPQYIDYFEEDSERDRGFFLVQELAQGASLAQLVEGGWRADEAEAKRIASQVLGILNYLGSRRPPVVHRDVKPENIVLEGGKAGGRVFLVDFGGVQAAAASDSFALGSTIIGTYGYMSPEQFRGAAQPASDLYGLGGTLLYLLSGKPPSSFPQERLQINFRDVVEVSSELGQVLDGLLEPVIEDRMPAADAMAVLAGQGISAPAGAEYQPPGARVKLRERRGSLRIDIPPASISSPEKLGLAGFALTWNVGIGVWTASAVAAGSLAAAAFSIPFWAAGFSVARDAFQSSFREERIEVGPKAWSISRSGRFLKRGGTPATPTVEGRSRDLKGVQVVVTGYVNGLPRTELKLMEGFREHRFGAGLSTMEQQWLATKITAFLRTIPGQPQPDAFPLPNQPGRRLASRREARWQGDPMWGPYWGPTGSGIYEADIVWEEDALQQKGDRDAAGSQGQAASQRLGRAGLEAGGNELTRDDLGMVASPDEQPLAEVPGDDA